MTWLKKNNIAFSFHDYKQKGIREKKLNEWCDKKGLEFIFNKRSATWKELPGLEQEKVDDQASAIKLMMQHNSIIKRPIIEKGNDLLIGYNETEYYKHIK